MEHSWSTGDSYPCSNSNGETILTWVQHSWGAEDPSGWSASAAVLKVTQVHVAKQAPFGTYLRPQGTIFPFSWAVAGQPFHQPLGCITEVKVVFTLLRQRQRGLAGCVIGEKTYPTRTELKEIISKFILNSAN